MPSYTEEFSEVHQMVQALHADNRAIGVYNTGWAAAHTHHRFVVLLDVGEMAQGATVDFVLQEATDALGTNAANIAGKAITQLTQAGGDGDDLIVMECRMEEMTPGYDYVRGVLTIAGGAVECALLGIGVVARYVPVPTGTITEIVH